MTRLLDPKPLIPVVCRVFNMHPATLLHGESTRTVTLAKWCCYHFMRRFSHASLNEIGTTLGSEHSCAQCAIKQIKRCLAGTRPEPRFNKGPSNESILDALTQCEAAILQHFPQLAPRKAPRHQQQHQPSTAPIIDAKWRYLDQPTSASPTSTPTAKPSRARPKQTQAA